MRMHITSFKTFQLVVGSQDLIFFRPLVLSKDLRHHRHSEFDIDVAVADLINRLLLACNRKRRDRPLFSTMFPSMVFLSIPFPPSSCTKFHHLDTQPGFPTTGKRRSSAALGSPGVLRPAVLFGFCFGASRLERWSWKLNFARTCVQATALGFDMR